MEIKNTIDPIKDEIKNLAWDIDTNEIVNLTKSCIRVITKNISSSLVIGKSKFGGKPDLPKGYSWPEIEGTPLAFIGQINCSDLESYQSFDPVFKNKIIYFFISVKREHYRNQNLDIHKTITIKIDKDLSRLEATPFPHDLKEAGIFKEVELAFSESFSFPSYHHWKILNLNLSDNDEELLEEVVEIIRRHTHKPQSIGHQIFGYANAIQGDTNYSWAKKNTANQDIDVSEIQKSFELLLQIDTTDKETDFNKSLDGGVYYGYKRAETISIECELQNT